MFPSSQAPKRGVWEQAPVESQFSAVQVFPSSQSELLEQQPGLVVR
jgi:hypothetical protein